MTHMSTPPDIDRIVFTRCAVRTATGIAADLGWLHDEFVRDGIAVVAAQDDEVGAARGRGARGLRVDLREGGNIPALWARSRGASTRLVGLTWLDERQVILGRAGDAPLSAADLRSRRVAVPRRDDVGIDFRRVMALRGLAGALSIAGLGLSDVRVVEIDAESRSHQGSPHQGSPHQRSPHQRSPHQGSPQQGAWRTGPWDAELEALRQGAVDAVYVKGALEVEAAQRFGASIVVDLDRFPDRRVRVNNGTPRPITVDQRVLDHRPDVVARFLTVLLQAAEWARGHHEPTTGGDLRPSLAPDVVRLLADQHRFLRMRGFLTQDVDLASWIDPAPLGAARDMADARRRYAVEPASFAASRAAHPSSCSAPATSRAGAGGARVSVAPIQAGVAR